MKTKVANVEFAEGAKFKSAEWDLSQFFIIPILVLLLVMSIIQEAGIKRTPITEIFGFTKEASIAVANNVSTQTTIEEERAPMPEPAIRMPKSIANGIFEIQKGQSLCTYLSLPDALDVATENRLPIFYRKDGQKFFIETKSEALALAKAGFQVIAIVQSGQRFKRK